MGLGELLFGLVIVWLAAKLAGEGMERLGQTAVLGELLAGVVIGPGVLGLVRESEILHTLAEIGVIILLFEIGPSQTWGSCSGPASSQRSWPSSGSPARSASAMGS
ncbi:MAG: cation:proton antiporter [Candidatus Rokubacteria bacterium]|nr:cation:proton antiporter [Candidatus Rokubacteria bacterium]